MTDLNERHPELKQGVEDARAMIDQLFEGDLINVDMYDYGPDGPSLAFLHREGSDTAALVEFHSRTSASLRGVVVETFIDGVESLGEAPRIPGYLAIRVPWEDIALEDSAVVVAKAQSPYLPHGHNHRKAKNALLMLVKGTF